MPTHATTYYSTRNSIVPQRYLTSPHLDINKNSNKKGKKSIIKIENQLKQGWMTTKNKENQLKFANEESLKKISEIKYESQKKSLEKQ